MDSDCQTIQRLDGTIWWESGKISKQRDQLWMNCWIGLDEEEPSGERAERVVQDDDVVQKQTRIKLLFRLVQFQQLGDGRASPKVLAEIGDGRARVVVEIEPI